MTSVVFIRSNPVNPDVRVEKEVTSLSQHGYSIKIIAWDRKSSTDSLGETPTGIPIIRFGIKAPLGVKVVLYWIIWWIRVFNWLMRNDWDVVHAADFDCYIPALLAAKLKQRKIIYDIYDFMPGRLPLPKAIYIIFRNTDLFFMRFADSIIIVDDCRYEQMNLSRDDNKVSVIYNSPVDIYDKNNVNTSTGNNVTIFYGGVISPHRDVLSMLHIARDMPNVSVGIAGGGNKEIIASIKSFSSNYENIEYYGILPYNEVLIHTMNANILFALYDPSTNNNKYSSPNKLFESMMLGKPIIMNSGIAAADIVQNHECGIIVEYGKYESLKNAVRYSLNPDVREKLGNNGRIAYEKYYSWTVMEKRLLRIYENFN